MGGLGGGCSGGLNGAEKRGISGRLLLGSSGAGMLGTAFGAASGTLGRSGICARGTVPTLKTGIWQLSSGSDIACRAIICGRLRTVCTRLHALVRSRSSKVQAHVLLSRPAPSAAVLPRLELRHRDLRHLRDLEARQAEAWRTEPGGPCRCGSDRRGAATVLLRIQRRRGGADARQREAEARLRRLPRHWSPAGALHVTLATMKWPRTKITRFRADT